MSVPVLTFFNNKGGVGKTSLVYHVSWMLAELGHRVVACDLDPQANLTAAFLDESHLTELWEECEEKPSTIYRCLRPLTRTGDIENPSLVSIAENLALLPGDLALAGFEDRLSTEWPASLGSGDLYRTFRVLSSFWLAAQMAASSHRADVVLFDVGPNFGAINRSALISSNHIVVPLSADLFSLQGLKNLGPTLHRWREDWKKRRDHWMDAEFDLPSGSINPVGYVVQQHGVRLSRPVIAYDDWVKRIPGEYRRSVLDEPSSSPELAIETDPNCLAILKHYRSLVPLSQEARKPIFHLTPADGAIGSHSQAVQIARQDFRELSEKILARIQLSS